MAEYWESTHQRGQQTLAVWNEFAPAFQVGTHTAALHEADVALLLTHVTARDTQQDAYDAAASARDTSYESLKDLNVRVPQAIEGNLEEGDVLLRELADVRAVTGQGQEGVMNRTRKVISLWNMVNTARVSASLPALVVGTTTVGTLTAALDDHPALLQHVEDEGALLNKMRTQLKGTDARVDRNNKRWYVAWSGNFAEGSPEIAALSQIDTGPGAPPPVGKAEITHAIFVDAGNIAHLDFEAVNATKFAVLRKAAGETSFTVRADDLPDESYEDAGLVPGTYQYQVVGSNSGGDGEASDAVSVVAT